MTLLSVDEGQISSRSTARWEMASALFSGTGTRPRVTTAFTETTWRSPSMEIAWVASASARPTMGRRAASVLGALFRSARVAAPQRILASTAGTDSSTTRASAEVAEELTYEKQYGCCKREDKNYRRNGGRQNDPHEDDGWNDDEQEWPPVPEEQLVKLVEGERVHPTEESGDQSSVSSLRVRQRSANAP